MGLSGRKWGAGWRAVEHVSVLVDGWVDEVHGVAEGGVEQALLTRVEEEDGRGEGYPGESGGQET